MNVSSLFGHRRDRRQRDPFTAAPVTRAPDPDLSGRRWSPEVTRQIADLTAQAEAEQHAAHDEDWWGLTELDNPPAHDRPYVPGVHVPDLDADIRGLPVFRDALRAAARWQHAGCACEPGDDAGQREWFAAQYACAVPGVPVLSWWAFRPAAADEAAPAEMGVAA